MLQHDYLLEIIAEFVQTVMNALRHARKNGDRESLQELDAAVCDLLDLDPQLALRLSPDSLVTMMLLSGLGDSLASYVAYALDKVGDAYDNMGDTHTAELRWDQAQAVAEAFGCDQDDIPAEFSDLDAELLAAE